MMEVFGFSEKLNISKNTALCLGNFDGVHLGHRRLFDVARNYGGWGVLVFDGNFKGDRLLTTLPEKIDLIEKLGADYIIIAKPEAEFLNLAGEDFYSILKERFGINMLVAGYDYRFGKSAKCSADDLEKWCLRDSLKVHIEKEYALFDEPVKSSRIRELIGGGDVAKANNLLGYNYCVSGSVEKGFGNGNKMGFPTANVGYWGDKILPADGVYKGTIYIKNIAKTAVINIGKNPTFDAKKRTVEVHIPNYAEDIYGEAVKVDFEERIRGEIRFESIDQLIERIRQDVEYVLAE